MKSWKQKVFCCNSQCKIVKQNTEINTKLWTYLERHRRKRQPQICRSHYCCYSWEALIQFCWDVLAELLSLGSVQLMISFKFVSGSHSAHIRKVLQVTLSFSVHLVCLMKTSLALWEASGRNTDTKQTAVNLTGVKYRCVWIERNKSETIDHGCCT